MSVRKTSWVRFLCAAVVPIIAPMIAHGAAGNAVAAGNAERGRVIAYTCLGCHGIPTYKNVYPTYSVPELFGQHAEYIVAALKEYKAGLRSHVTMHVQAESLSDQDMEDVAAYLSGGAPLKSTGTVVGTPPPKVAQLCVACHGKDGVSVSPEYPSLAGQHADYLSRALQEYKYRDRTHGDRENPIMGTFVTSLSDEDINQIAEYYSQQKPSLETEPRRLTRFSARD